MKFVILLAFLVVICANNCQCQSHNSFWGQVGWNDTLAFRTVVYKSSSFMQVVTKDVSFPSPGSVNYRNITAIRAIDNLTNGKGGYASILSGGLNFTRTTLHFKSQRGNSFNFTMEVYVR